MQGFQPQQIIYTPNGVSFEELEEVAQLGVQINIDNLSVLEHFGTKHPTIPVCITHQSTCYGGWKLKYLLWAR